MLERFLQIQYTARDEMDDGRAFGHDINSAVHPAPVPLATCKSRNAVQPAMRIFNKQCDYLREDRLRGRDTFFVQAQYQRVARGPTGVMQGDPHVKAGGSPRSLVRGWREHALPSCRVLRMSGRADPFDALGAEGRRPLAPCWVIRMSAVGGPRDGFWLYGGASPPVRLGDPDVGRMGDPLAGLPLYTHTGGITGTARGKQSNEHEYSGKFIMGGF